MLEDKCTPTHCLRFSLRAWGRSGFRVKNNWLLRCWPSLKRCRTPSCADLPPYPHFRFCRHLTWRETTGEKVKLAAKNLQLRTVWDYTTNRIIVPAEMMSLTEDKFNIKSKLMEVVIFQRWNIFSSAFFPGTATHRYPVQFIIWIWWATTCVRWMGIKSEKRFHMHELKHVTVKSWDS